MAFENFGLFARKFKKNPLSDENAEGLNASFEMDVLFSGSKGKPDKRLFVDWKLIMISFTLLNSAQPTEQHINDYVSALKDVQQGDLISLDDFLQVRAWFDTSEGTHDQPEGKKRSDMESDDDEEEDEGNLDMERVCKIKTLLYNTLR